MANNFYIHEVDSDRCKFTNDIFRQIRFHSGSFLGPGNPDHSFFNQTGFQREDGLPRFRLVLCEHLDEMKTTAEFAFQFDPLGQVPR